MLSAPLCEKLVCYCRPVQKMATAAKSKKNVKICAEAHVWINFDKVKSVSFKKNGLIGVAMGIEPRSSTTSRVCCHDAK